MAFIINIKKCIFKKTIWENCYYYYFFSVYSKKKISFQNHLILFNTALSNTTLFSKHIFPQQLLAAASRHVSQWGQSSHSWKSYFSYFKKYLFMTDGQRAQSVPLSDCLGASQISKTERPTPHLKRWHGTPQHHLSFFVFCSHRFCTPSPSRQSDMFKWSSFTECSFK